MEIVAAAGNTALHILAVVPEVQCKDGLGVAPLVHLLIHQRTLLRADHQLGYRAFAGGHIGKEPGKLTPWSMSQSIYSSEASTSVFLLV